MLTINTLKTTSLNNNLNKEVKAYNFIETLINEKTTIKSEKNPKNNTIEYYFTIDEHYTIKYQPSRDEIILKCDNVNYLEVYVGKAYKVCTRGMYLLKLTFKNSKKDEALKSITSSNCTYHPKWDMKHKIDNLPLDVASTFVKKFWKLDNNATIKKNEYVKEGEDLDSKKSIYLKNRDEEVEEEEAQEEGFKPSS